MLNDISAIVLAGGKSSRMGRDKCNLMYNNLSLLNWQIKKLADLGISDIVVSGYKGTGAIDDVNAEVSIAKDDISLGPISGIATSLPHIKNSKALILSVDVPLLLESDLIALIEKHKDNKNKITVLLHGDKVEPLIGVYDKSVCEEAMKITNETNHSIMHLIEETRYGIYETDTDKKHFLNVNYLSDYEELNQYKSKI